MRNEPSSRPAIILNVLGFMLLLIGAAIAASAFAMQTTVGDVHNIGLLGERIVRMIAGVGIAIIGAIWFAK